MMLNCFPCYVDVDIGKIIHACITSKNLICHFLWKNSDDLYSWERNIMLFSLCFSWRMEKNPFFSRVCLFKNSAH